MDLRMDDVLKAITVLEKKGVELRGFEIGHDVWTRYKQERREREIERMEPDDPPQIWIEELARLDRAKRLYGKPMKVIESAPECINLLVTDMYLGGRTVYTLTEVLEVVSKR